MFITQIGVYIYIYVNLFFIISNFVVSWLKGWSLGGGLAYVYIYIHICIALITVSTIHCYRVGQYPTYTRTLNLDEKIMQEYLSKKGIAYWPTVANFIFCYFQDLHAKYMVHSPGLAVLRGLIEIEFIGFINSFRGLGF